MELFFKWIKQNLKVKRFVGTTRNAVMTQLWIAARMYLLVCYVKFLSRRGWRLVEFLRLLQLNLFERRPLDDLRQKAQAPPPRLMEFEREWSFRTTLSPAISSICRHPLPAATIHRTLGTQNTGVRCCRRTTTKAGTVGLTP